MPTIPRLKSASTPVREYDGGGCQLWRLVPAGGGWSRLQLRHGGQYLDADHCTTKVGLNPGSDYDGGGCQLWRLVPAGGGWSRLQLKHGGQYLDADHCFGPGGLESWFRLRKWRLSTMAAGSRRIEHRLMLSLRRLKPRISSPIPGRPVPGWSRGIQGIRRLQPAGAHS
jgi:ricin-type beta-trefoil lectin protein